ncbi:hypothetical protein LTR70_007314 [Exophiala xenobiotica]|uniref:DUF647-domain-containing protein n=1 Tax=Lithohypha guttulata TaxID=1690604 RepID=A0ABR0K5J1_9EURO|nr:hypothetical protein LTR24_007084 [Lithohypha guttulata]KAK5314103.1 hypothetical protein LTR70_007314 [Exophiala xenobiotica]
MASDRQLTLKEIDPTSGQTTKTYVLSRSNTGLGSEKQLMRLDQVPSQINTSPKSTSIALTQSSSIPVYLSTYSQAILDYLKSLFLPTGYPHTVTPDYTPYQIYDSIQAFASTIAGLLSSRAVLQSLNVISSSPSDATDSAIPSDSASAATAATLLSILQSTLSNLTTILFASHAAPRISCDVKFYRFLADIANDAAFVLDLLAPSLPGTFSAMTSHLSFSHSVPLTSPYTALLRLHRLEVLVPFIPSPRVVVLCTSSMLRAVCGVAGGSSKAVLSAHFARNNPENVGDLNAKDGSQETVVNLLGMWIGGLVVSRVEGVGATWTWMLVLLGVHLWANYRAVKSVRLRGLNRERAGKVMMQIARGGLRCFEDVDVDAIGGSESVLGLRSWLVGRLARLYGHERVVTWQSWSVGVSVEEFMRAVSGSDHGSKTMKRSGSLVRRVPTELLSSLISTLERERYLIWLSEDDGRVVVALKKDAMPVDQLRACYHASLMQERRQRALQRGEGWQTIDLLTESLEKVRQTWEDVRRKLEVAGWDLSSTNLVGGRGVRIDLS